MLKRRVIIRSSRLTFSDLQSKIVSSTANHKMFKAWPITLSGFIYTYIYTCTFYISNHLAWARRVGKQFIKYSFNKSWPFGTEATIWIPWLTQLRPTFGCPGQSALEPCAQPTVLWPEGRQVLNKRLLLYPSSVGWEHKCYQVTVSCPQGEFQTSITLRLRSSQSPKGGNTAGRDSQKPDCLIFRFWSHCELLRGMNGSLWRRCSAKLVRSDYWAHSSLAAARGVTALAAQTRETMEGKTRSLHHRVYS